MLGNENNPLKARTQGVRVARDATGAKPGTPQKVTHVVEGKIVFVQYNDEQGRPSVVMYFKVGEELYAPADSVSWCASLRPAAPWLAEGIANFQKDNAPVVIPTQDSVDVMDDAQ